MQATELNFLQTITQYWSKGGWVILPLMALSIYLYYTLFQTILNTRSCYSNLQQPKGTKKQNSSWSTNMEALQLTYIRPIERHIKLISIMAAAAPLLGLLGTVSGMVTTFDGLSHFGNTKFPAVSIGISEALISTQLGLIIAIPALIMLPYLRSTKKHIYGSLMQWQVNSAINTARS